MSDTVSNQSKTIATKKSTHTAKFTAPDVCKLPNMTPTPFENAVGSKKCTAGTSNDTFIKDAEICLTRTHVGPKSGPAHAGTVGGVTSGTYIQEAQATDGSPDVRVEGDKPVRTGDPTKQNHGNTVGSVIAGTYTPSAESLTDQAKKKCTLIKFEGVSEGRNIGWPTPKEDGDPYYIEILDRDIVTFTTERKETTLIKDGANPACLEAPNHTAWHAKTMRYPTFVIPNEETDNGETFIVEATWAVEEWLLKILGFKAPAEKDGIQDRENTWGTEEHKDAEEPDWDKRKEEERGKVGPHYSAGGLVLNGSKHADNAAADKSVNKEKNQWQKDNSYAGRNTAKWEKGNVMTKATAKLIILYWMWKLAPPVINVTATVCAGARKAEVKVFPFRKWKFEWTFAEKSRSKRGYPSRQLRRKAERSQAKADASRQKQRDKALAKYDNAERNFEMITSALRQIHKFTDVARKIARFSGNEMDVKFLTNFGFEWVIQYKRCTRKDGAYKRWQYTPAHCGREWEIALDAEPWIGMDAEVKFGLLKLAGPIGAALRATGLARVDVVFGADIGILGAIKVGKDEYDYLSSAGGELGVDITLSAALVVGVAFINIRFRAAFPAKGKVFIGWTKEAEGIVMKPEASIRSNFDITIFPDSWWEIEMGSYSPEWGRTSWSPKQPIMLYSMPS